MKNYLFIYLFLFSEAPGGPPLDVNGASISSTAFELTWSPPQESVQNGRIRNYYLTIIGEYRRNYWINGTARRFVVSNLSPSSFYICYLSAVTVARGPTANLTITLPEDSE